MSKEKFLIELLEQRLMLSASINDDNTIQEKEFINEKEEVKSHSNELIIIDSSVQDYQSFLSLLPSDALILFIAENENGVEKITNFLSDYDDLSAIHIVSHGNNSELLLGNEELNKNTINNYENQLKSWSNSFNKEADFFIYGCNLASDETGKEFVKTLASLTSLDLNASDDLTGNEELGGNWDLEFSVGKIERESLVIEDFEGILLADKEFFGTNLKLWLDGKDIDGNGTEDITSVNMNTWKDKSSNMGDFTSSGDPTRISNGGIDFDGTGDYYSYSGDKTDFDFLSTSADNSIFLVAKTEGSAYHYFLTTKSSNNMNGMHLFVDNFFGNLLKYGLKNDLVSITNTTNGIIGKIGNKLTNFKEYETSIPTGGFGSATDKLRIGISPSGTSLDGEIYEILVFNKALNTSEQLLIINYLQAKWGSIVSLNSSNDKFNKTSYNNDVIGITQTSSSDKYSETKDYIGALLLKDNGFLKDNKDSVFIGHNNANGFSREWYIDVNDENSNGGNVDLIFNLVDLGLSGKNVSLNYSADGISNWSSVGTGSSLGDIYSFDLSVTKGHYKLKDNNFPRLLGSSIQVEENNLFVSSLSSISNFVTTYSLLTGLDKSEFTLTGEKLTFNNLKNYELDTRTYSLKLKLSNISDSLIRTLTISLRNVNDAPVLSSFFF